MAIAYEVDVGILVLLIGFVFKIYFWMILNFYVWERYCYEYQVIKMLLMIMENFWMNVYVWYNTFKYNGG